MQRNQRSSRAIFGITDDRLDEHTRAAPIRMSVPSDRTVRFISSAGSYVILSQEKTETFTENLKNRILVLLKAWTVASAATTTSIGL